MSSNVQRLFLNSDNADEGTPGSFITYMTPAIIDARSCELIYAQIPYLLKNFPEYANVFYFTQAGNLQTVQLPTVANGIFTNVNDLISALNSDLGNAGFNPSIYSFSFSTITQKITFNVNNGFTCQILPYNSPLTPNSIVYRLGWTQGQTFTNSTTGDSPPKLIRTSCFYIASNALSSGTSLALTQNHQLRNIISVVPCGGAAFGDITYFTPTYSEPSTVGSGYLGVIAVVDIQIYDDELELIDDFPTGSNVIVAFRFNYDR
jgi:hypothetical protein